MLKSFKYQRNMEAHFNRIPVLNVVNHKPIRQCIIFDLSLTLLNDPAWGQICLKLEYDICGRKLLHAFN